MKKCTKCSEEKNVTNFYKHPKTKDGLYPSCKDCQREYSKIYVRSQQHKEYNSKYQKTEKYREYARSYFREKYKEEYHSNPQLKIANNLRKRLRTSLKENKGIRIGSAIRDLGCSISELKAHLETRFKEGMSWENYGSWHIDHIKPLSKFDLTDRSQFLEVCHYTNLQPLWAYENMSKGNR